MINMVLVAVIAACVVLSGVCLYRRKRSCDVRDMENQKKSQAAFLALERRRFKAFPRSCKKEIERIVKENYPNSNNHQRRAVAARYLKMIKNS